MTNILPVLLSKPKGYSRRVLDTFGSSLIAYYPLDDVSGTAARDLSGNGRNATYSGSPTLSNTKSFHGKKCPLFSGTSYVTLPAGYRSAFDPAEGTFSAWYKYSGAWVDGVTRYLALIITDANNTISFVKGGATNALVVTYKAGGTTETKSLAIPSASWFNITLTWSKSNDRVRFYVNGALAWSSATLGTWSGAIGAVYLGNSSTSWNGWISDAVTLNREATPDEVNALTPRMVTVSLFGDSITALGYDYWRYPSNLVLNGWKNGNAGFIDHAAAGASIAAQFAGQVAAAASDNANIAIIHMGTNDNNAGDMSTLQGIAEAGIDSLRASNPGIEIYVMNVLKRWTDVTKTTEVDKSNIRAMWEAVGASRNVPIINAYDWTTSVSDGIHPDATGHAEIAAQLITRL